jgi:hypothetical protein
MTTSFSLDVIDLVYADESGNEYTQSLSKLAEAGALIDPDTGDDLTLVGWRFA